MAQYLSCWVSEFDGTRPGKSLKAIVSDHKKVWEPWRHLVSFFAPVEAAIGLQATPELHTGKMQHKKEKKNIKMKIEDK